MQVSFFGAASRPVHIPAEKHLLCAECAIWKPKREDSVADEYGICPRKMAPNNITHASECCANPVRPIE